MSLHDADDKIDTQCVEVTTFYNFNKLTNTCKAIIYINLHYFQICIYKTVHFIELILMGVFLFTFLIRYILQEYSIRFYNNIQQNIVVIELREDYYNILQSCIDNFHFYVSIIQNFGVTPSIIYTNSLETIYEDDEDTDTDEDIDTDEDNVADVLEEQKPEKDNKDVLEEENPIKDNTENDNDDQEDQEEENPIKDNKEDDNYDQDVLEEENPIKDNKEDDNDDQEDQEEDDNKMILLPNNIKNPLLYFTLEQLYNIDITNNKYGEEEDEEENAEL